MGDAAFFGAGDTRIFSPLLYQLSYDTIVLVCGCKDKTLF